MTRVLGASGCDRCAAQQLPPGVEHLVERPPDLHGHDSRHPHVHGTLT